MKTVELHGALGDRFGREFQFDVQSPAEAISALVYQIDGFEEAFSEGYYELYCGPMSYNAEMLTFAFRDRLHIIPCAAGSKKGGAGKLILGVALLGLAFAGGVGLFGFASQAGFLTAAGTGTAAGTFQATLLGGAVKFFGMSALIGGASQLLSPKPKVVSNREVAASPSMLINGAIQTVEEGAAHPICLGGPFMCGSHVISGGLYVEEVDLVPTGGYYGGGGGGGGGGGSYDQGTDTYGNTYRTSTLNSMHYDMVTIHGAKGKGGGKARIAKEADNTLLVEMSAKVKDLISVGEVFGWDDPAHPLRCYFMEETPIERDDGNGGDFANYKGLEVHTRYGTPGQDHVPGYTEQTGEVQVGPTVLYGSANRLVRTVTDQTLDAVRVTLLFPVMTEQNTENGDLNGSSVSYRIGVRANTWSDFEWRVQRYLSEKFTSAVQIQHRLELPPGEGPWDIAVERLTPESTSSAINNSFSWLSYTRIVDAKLSHPGSAYVATTVSAKQFGDKIPGRSFLWRGIICSVPSNYDPVTRIYDGIWDGSWKRAWTNNGLWVTHEVLTNTDWGLGEHVPAGLLNKFAAYEIAKICDQPVPDGKGGFEPRWRMSAWTNTVEDARTYLQTLCSNFLGTMLWGRGAVQFMADYRKKTKKIVTNANVFNGKFVYEGLARKAIYTVALVTWNDPDNFYKPRIETVEAAPELIEKYGRRTKDVFAFGCTSRGQARRQGLWEIYRDIYSNPFVTYKAGLDHAQVLPGEVVDVFDVDDQGIRMGGRLESVDGASVTMNAPFDFQPGKNYVMEIALPDPELVYPSFARSIVTGGVGSNYVDLNITIEGDDSWAGTLTQGARVKSVQGLKGARIYLSDTVGLNEGPVTLEFTSVDGGPIEQYAIERTVVNPGVTATTIQLTEPVGVTDPERFSLVFGLRTDDLLPSQFTVLSFEESDDDEFEIVGLRYVPELYPLIEDGKEFTPRPTSLYDTTEPVDPPSNPVALYKVVPIPSGSKEFIELSFQKSPSPMVQYYEILWRYSNGVWNRLETMSNNVEIPYKGAGVYEFTISAVPSYGKQSAPISYSTELDGTRPIEPSTILNLRVSGKDPVESVFEGRSLKVVWEVAVPEGFLPEPEPVVTIPGMPVPEPEGPDPAVSWKDPFLKDYEINVCRQDGSLLRAYYTVNRYFEYTAEMLSEDNGGIMLRNLMLKVRVRDNFDGVLPWKIKNFSNPSPAAPTYRVYPSVTGFTMIFDPSVETDFAQNCVWISAPGEMNTARDPDFVSSQDVIEVNTGAGIEKLIVVARTDSWSSNPQSSAKSAAISTTSASTDPNLTSGNTTHVGNLTAAQIAAAIASIGTPGGLTQEMLDAIDAKILEAQADFNAAIAGINDRLLAAEILVQSTRDDFDGRLEDIETDLDGFGQVQSAHTTAINGRVTYTDFNAQVLRINGNEAAYGSLLTLVNDTNETVASNYETLQTNFTTGLSTANGRIDSLTTSTTNATSASNSRISTIETDFYTPTTGALAKITSIQNTLTNGTLATASQLTSLSTNFTTQLTTANGRIDDLITSTTNANSSVVQRVGSLESTFNTPVTGTQARIASLETITTNGTFASTQRLNNTESVYNQAIADRIQENIEAKARLTSIENTFASGTLVTASQLSSLSTTLSGQIGTANGRIDTLISSTSTANTAAVNRLDALESSFNTPVSGALARINRIDTLVSGPTFAQSSRVDTIEAYYTTPTTGALARLNSIENTFANGVYATATRVNQVESRFDGPTGAFAKIAVAESTAADALGKANAVRSVTLDVNGVVTGTTSTNNGTTTGFKVQANNFQIVSSTPGQNSFDYSNGLIKIRDSGGNVRVELGIF